MNNLAIETQSKEQFSLFNVSSLESAMQMADMVSKSSFCPPQYKGKPADILIAVEMGRQIGLNPFSALQGIAVINNRPTIWGDTMLALVKGHKDFEWMEEEFSDNKATCKIKRKGQPVISHTFTIDDARRAGLLNRPVWKTFPKRMLQCKPRSFACRDAFPDALNGLISAEEAIDITPAQTNASKVNNLLKQKTEFSNNENITIIEDCENVESSAEVNSDYTKMIEQEALENDKKNNIVDKTTKLLELVAVNNISNQVLDKWLTKANVDTFEDMAESQLDSCINYLQKQYKESINAATI